MTNDSHIYLPLIVVTLHLERRRRSTITIYMFRCFSLIHENLKTENAIFVVFKHLGGTSQRFPVRLTTINYIGPI